MSHVPVCAAAKLLMESPKRISNALYANDFPRDQAPVVGGRRMLSPAAVDWLREHFKKAGAVPAV